MRRNALRLVRPTRAGIRSESALRRLSRPIARATNTGLTAIIDQRGRVTARAAPFEQTVLRGELVPQRGLTPFARFGETPVTLLSLALCLTAWRRGRSAGATAEPARRRL